MHLAVIPLFGLFGLSYAFFSVLGCILTEFVRKGSEEKAESKIWEEQGPGPNRHSRDPQGEFFPLLFRSQAR